VERVCPQAPIQVDQPGNRERLVSYSGAQLNNKRHGKGKATYDYGNVFDGEWHEGERHGMGTQTYSDGDAYVGAWAHGRKHGAGTYTWKDGATYVGDWLNNKRHGDGKMTCSNSEMYNGVENSRRNDEYNGQWQHGKYHGRGVYSHYTDNMTYSGDWVEGLRCGNGKITFTDGDVYTDTFFNDKAQGGVNAKYTTAAGAESTGKAAAQLARDAGATTYLPRVRIQAYGLGDEMKAGIVYVGERSSSYSNMPHGKGTATFSDNSKYEGDWMNGLRHGKGRETYTDGDYYDGDWQNDTPCGHGTQTYGIDNVHTGKRSGTWYGLGTVKFGNGDTFTDVFEKRKPRGSDAAKFTCATTGAVTSGEPAVVRAAAGLAVVEAIIASYDAALNLKKRKAASSVAGGGSSSSKGKGKQKRRAAAAVDDNVDNDTALTTDNDAKGCVYVYALPVHLSSPDAAGNIL
jgi:hypothetical protein